MQGERVAAPQIPVGSETSLSHSPVVKVLLVRMKLRTSAEGLAVNAIVEALSVSAAVAEAEETLIETSASRSCKHAVSLAGFSGDDINHRIDRVRSPDRSTRSANNFNSLNIFK